MKSPGRGILISTGLTALLLSACALRPSASSRTEDLSRQSLREALIAMNQGDDARAEQQLLESLARDPLNDRSRTTLASLYARQAGVKVQRWLDPMLEAGRSISARMHNADQAADLVNTIDDEVADAALRSAENVNGDIDQQRAKIKALGRDLSRLLLVGSLVVDTLRNLPDLNPQQMAKLDQAIQTLRDGALTPTERSEEARVYQAVLSLVKVVNEGSSFFNSNKDFKDMLRKDRLCTMKSGELREKLTMLHESLQLLEEGLVVSPKDPETTQRAAKVQLQIIVMQINSNPVWTQLDRLFDGNSSEGKIARNLGQRFCGATPDGPRATASTN